MLSVGRVITWSGPANATGALCSGSVGFLQEIINSAAEMNNTKRKKIFFIKLFSGLKLQLPHLVG